MLNIPNIQRRNSAQLTWAIAYIRNATPPETATPHQIIPLKHHTDRTTTWGAHQVKYLRFKDWFDVVPQHVPLIEACLFHDSVDLLDLILDQASVCGAVHQMNKTLKRDHFAVVRENFIRGAHANLACQLLLTHLWPEEDNDQNQTHHASYKEVACDDGNH